ncbi:MAG: DUF6230 family protein [Candidatus Dormiibacterota bacterium]
MVSTAGLSGGTRWRRFGLVFVPGLGVLVAMLYLLATGALAVSFSMSGIPFILNATKLEGTNFVQYGTIDPLSQNLPTSGGLIPTPVTGTATKSVGGATYAADTVTKMDTATITGLDQTVCVPLPFGGYVKVRTGASTADATGLLASAPDLTASSATFDSGLASPVPGVPYMLIGTDAGSALGIGANGAFAQAAPHAVINNVHQVALGTTAGSFTLHDLNLQASFETGCPPMPAPSFTPVP